MHLLSIFIALTIGIAVAAPTSVLNEDVSIDNVNTTLTARHHCEPVDVDTINPNWKECDPIKINCGIADYEFNTKDHKLQQWLHVGKGVKDPNSCEVFRGDVKGIRTSGMCRCAFWRGDACKGSNGRPVFELWARNEYKSTAMRPPLGSYRCWRDKSQGFEWAGAGDGASINNDEVVSDGSGISDDEVVGDRFDISDEIGSIPPESSGPAEDFAAPQEQSGLVSDVSEVPVPPDFPRCTTPGEPEIHHAFSKRDNVTAAWCGFVDYELYTTDPEKKGILYHYYPPKCMPFRHSGGNIQAHCSNCHCRFFSGDECSDQVVLFTSGMFPYYKPVNLNSTIGSYMCDNFHG